jgi:hypothetical protein
MPAVRFKAECDRRRVADDLRSFLVVQRTRWTQRRAFAAGLRYRLQRLDRSGGDYKGPYVFSKWGNKISPNVLGVDFRFMHTA